MWKLKDNVRFATTALYILLWRMTDLLVYFTNYFCWKTASRYISSYQIRACQRKTTLSQETKSLEKSVYHSVQIKRENSVSIVCLSRYLISNSSETWVILCYKASCQEQSSVRLSHAKFLTVVWHTTYIMFANTFPCWNTKALFSQCAGKNAFHLHSTSKT